MTRQQLADEIRKKQSFLCIGLDTDLKKIPSHLLTADDPVFEFNRQIIDATREFCVAYKINTAFYESRGVPGWQSMLKTFEYLPENIFSIADAKRGDIGNTSAMYAQAFFEAEQTGFNFDAITVAPYMGEDSVKPFMEHKNKWVILLALTSNEGSRDFQFRETDGEKLFESVIVRSQRWGTAENMMFVVGATHPQDIKRIRQLAPGHFFLVPGIGAQGGDLNVVAKYGMNHQCGLLVNASRNIIYASPNEDFAAAAAQEAKKIQLEMKVLLAAL